MSYEHQIFFYKATLLGCACASFECWSLTHALGVAMYLLVNSVLEEPVFVRRFGSHRSAESLRTPSTVVDLIKGYLLLTIIFDNPPSLCSMSAFNFEQNTPPARRVLYKTLEHL